MIGLALAAILLVAAVLCILTVFQTMYTDSLRLRGPDLPALEFFKETLEDRIGLETRHGVLVISMIKHTLLLLLGILCIAAAWGAPVGWELLLEASLFGWLTMLLSTYVLAPLLYRKTSGHWLLPLAPILKTCALLVRPLTAVLGFFQSLVELAEPEKVQVEAPGPANDIDALISAGEEEGIIEAQDRKLIESVVAFGDKTVREIMTPRPKIVAIEANRSLENLRELVIHEQYSRVPVYEHSIDNIIGFVHVRDVFELDPAERRGRLVQELVRPIRFVPETKPVNTLLREMQNDGAHMAIVIDEYGNTAGLATMEDMVEEIVGEIHDEHEPERDVQKETEGSFVVSGSLDLDRLRELLGFRPREETESTTIGGLITEWLGRVPRVGETLEREGIRMEVLAGDELKVDRVRISKAEAETVTQGQA
ncbi:MAG TPA: hemolysin family protein [Bryobacteraceae bacterium]|nr:hemolysin family protein [Bryobacteraceae bacterium]